MFALRAGYPGALDYLAPLETTCQWLVGNQSADGSWGDFDDELGFTASADAQRSPRALSLLQWCDARLGGGDASFAAADDPDAAPYDDEQEEKPEPGESKYKLNFDASMFGAFAPLCEATGLDQTALAQKYCSMGTPPVCGARSFMLQSLNLEVSMYAGIIF